MQLMYEPRKDYIVIYIHTPHHFTSILRPRAESQRASARRRNNVSSGEGDREKDKVDVSAPGTPVSRVKSEASMRAMSSGRSQSNLRKHPSNSSIHPEGESTQRAQSAATTRRVLAAIESRDGKAKYNSWPVAEFSSGATLCVCCQTPSLFFVFQEFIS